MIKNSNTPLVIAHRGASNIAPENTLLAFQKAIDLKADYIEFDLQKTKDNHLVITHDEDLFRITGFKGLVKNLTLNELRKLDFGSGELIPTLDELIQLTRGKIGLNCEIKVKGIVEKTIDLIRSNDIVDSTIISSFIHRELLEFKKLEPQLKIASLNPAHTGWIINWFSRKNVIKKASKNQFYAINPLYLIAKKRFVDKAHEKNLKVFPWTVDSTSSIENLIKMGVDGIISNNVSRVKEIINKTNTLKQSSEVK